MQPAPPPSFEERAIVSHVVAAGLVHGPSRLMEPNAALDTWIQLERFADEFHHRALSERLRDRQRLFVQRMTYSSTARKLFGKSKPPEDSLLEQFKKTHSSFVDELQAMVSHARSVATTFTRMGHVWSSLVQADASAMVDQSHKAFMAAGSRMASLCMTCATDILGVVVQPLQVKLDKLKQLTSLVQLEEDLRLLALAAARKLERAQATGSKAVFQRQCELTLANGYASQVTADLKTILTWVDSTRSQIVRLEMTSLTRLVSQHTKATSEVLLKSSCSLQLVERGHVPTPLD